MVLKQRFHKFRENRLFLPFGAVICSLLWGSAFPMIRIAHRYFDSSVLANHFAFAGLRFTLAGFLVLIFTPKVFSSFKDCPKWGILAVTLFQVVFQYVLFYWGLKLAPAVLGAILISSGSFFWVLLAPLVDKRESLSLKQFLLILMGFCGVCICLMNKQGGGDNVFSAVLFIGAALCGVIAALLVRPLNKKIPVPFIAGFSLFFGGVILSFLSPQHTMGLLEMMNVQLAMITLWLAVVSSAAFSLWYYLITLYDVPRLSAYRMLIPLCGVLESVLFLPEENLHANFFIGGACVFLSIILLENLKRPQRVS